MEYIARTEKDTQKTGEALAQTLTGGDIVLLYGELGAGKTTFTKGLAQALGIKEIITSPTFALMNVYNIKTKKHKNKKTLAHIDTYRLKDEQELVEIGAEDYLGQKDTVCVIEWPEKLKNLLKNKKTIKVSIEHLKKERKIIIKL